MKKIQQILKEQILVLDGAMGTMIQNFDLSEKDFRGDKFRNWHIHLQGNNDLLSITRPDIITQIHSEFLEAGANILETNTFSSNAIAMEDYEMASYVNELNLAAVKCAQNAIQAYRNKTNTTKPLLIAGSMGPTNKTASLSPEVEDPAFRAVTFNDLEQAYYEQAKSLWEAGADILLVETVFDTLNAKAALYAIQNLGEALAVEIPIMLSGTITDASGRTLSGQTTEAFLISVSHVPLLSIGLNCALGAKQLTPYIEILSKQSQFPVSVHPNAGLPNAFGQYEQTPEEMVIELQTYFEKGLLNIVGGCCGTTPAHIKAITEIVSHYKPRHFSI